MMTSFQMYIFLFAVILFHLLFHRNRCFPNSLYNFYTADDDDDDDDDGDDNTVAQYLLQLLQGWR